VKTEARGLQYKKKDLTLFHLELSVLALVVCHLNVIARAAPLDLLDVERSVHTERGIINLTLSGQKFLLSVGERGHRAAIAWPEVGSEAPC